MADTEIKKLKTLLREEKYDEAEKTLTEIFARPWESKDRASFYLQFSSLYFELLRQINERYNNDLKEILHNVESQDAPKKGPQNSSFVESGAVA